MDEKISTWSYPMSNKVTISIEVEISPKTGKPILDPIRLWEAACEAMELKDVSFITGIDGDAYYFMAMDSVSEEIVAEVRIG